MKIFKLRELVPGIVRWIHEITPNYLPSCRVKLHGSSRNIKYTTGEYPMNYAVDELTGTEETVWCPMLGIKGQIDMVLKTANYSKEDKDTHSPRRSYNLPLEVKTGKYNPNTAITHRAQVCFLRNLLLLLLFLLIHSSIFIICYFSVYIILCLLLDHTLHSYASTARPRKLLFSPAGPHRTAKNSRVLPRKSPGNSLISQPRYGSI